MKKTVALILAIAMFVAVSAFAEGIPSKTTADMTKFAIVTENADNEGAALYTAPSEAADAALADLIKVGSIAKYFENAVDVDGNPVKLDDTQNVDEFAGLFASGFTANCGDVTTTMKFATPYKVDQKVTVMVGLVNGNDIAWTAFEGIGVDDAELGEGCIKTVLSEKVVMDVQNGTGLIAVISE